MKKIEDGLEIIDGLLQKYPKDHDLLSYKAYWLQFLDRKVESIEIIQKLIENEPDIGIYYDTLQIHILDLIISFISSIFLYGLFSYNFI